MITRLYLQLSTSCCLALFAWGGLAPWASAQVPSGDQLVSPAPGQTSPSLNTEKSPALPPAPAAQPEPKVLIAEVRVVATKGTLAASLEDKIYDVLKTRPGQTTNRSQLQQDINAVFATGYFSDVKASPEDTSIGVRVTFSVVPNPVLEGVSAVGSTLLPDQVLQDTFKPQVGQTLNFGELQKGVKSVEEWYAERGYVLAKVSDVQSSPDGRVKLVVTEGIIEDVRVKGNGRTRDFIITRELGLKSGNVFNRNIIQRDLQRVYALGIFKDVSLDLTPGQQDPQKVIVNLKIEEKGTGSISAGAGNNSSSGLFATVSLQEQNFGGNNQKVGLDVQAGGQTFLFNLGFTDPWLAGDPKRTAMSINLYDRQQYSYAFNGGGVGLNSDGETPRETRIGLSTVFSRTLGDGWRGSAGGRFEWVQLRDYYGSVYSRDVNGNPLNSSGGPSDTLLFLQTSVARDTRDKLEAPRSGSLLSFSIDQTVPFASSALFSRPTATYSQYIPVDVLPFGKDKQVFAFNTSFGTALGDLPPYEAFVLGGSNSVRGFNVGQVAVGRSYLLGTAEFRTPLFDPVGAVLFVDYGTDLGTAASVLGAPGIVHGKYGSGVGYGIGLRIQSPLGPLRIDFALNNIGLGSQIHFGLGEKF